MIKHYYIILILLFPLVLNAEFDIEKFTDPGKYGWNSEENYQQARNEINMRQNIIQLYEMKKSDLKLNVVKSMVFPGWGHFAVKKYTRGEILLGLEVVFLGTAFYYYDQAMDNYDKYKKADYIEDINKYYQKAEQPYKYSQTFLALGIITWLFGIYDTINVTTEYNVDLWESLNDIYYEESPTIGFSAYPLGYAFRL